MRENNFENKVKDLLYDHQEAAPDVLGKVFQKRTPLYILRNKLILNKYKLLAASIAVGFFIGLFSLFNDLFQDDNNVVDNTGTESTITQPSQKSENADVTDYTDNKIQAEESNDNSNAASPLNKMDKAVSNMLNDTRKPNTGLSTNSTNNGSIVSTNDDSPKATPIYNIDVKPGNSDEATNDLNNVKGQQVASADQNSEKATDSKNITTDAEPQNNISEVEDKGAIVKDDRNPSEIETSSNVNEADQTQEPGNGEEFELPKTLPSKWSISFGAGLGLGNRDLESKDASSMIVRNQSEKQSLSYSTELMLNYAATEQLDVFIGANLFKRRESMVYEYPYTVTNQNITSKVVIQQHPVFGPRPVTVYDTTYTTEDKLNSGSSNNVYNHITVPLGLRYTLQYNERLGISMSLSGGLEVVTSAKGMVLDGAYNEISLSNSYNKPAFGKVLGCGIGLSYKMNENWSLLFEPRGMWYLSPSSIDGTNVNQWEQGYNAMFGLKFRL